MKSDFADVPRYGIFGGTFDPVHIGHLILADEALNQLNLSQVIWVLTPNSPHKDASKITDVGIRLSLLEASLYDRPRFVISKVDINRKPPHFAVDTLRILRQSYPNAHFVYLMGGDSLLDLPSWYQPEAFLSYVDELGILKRPGYNIDLSTLENALPALTKRIQWVEAPGLEISSSRIRDRILSGRAFRYFLHPKAYELISENKYYVPLPLSS
jgi:nicotinate-nucleotide adenylyltransferase